MFSPFATTKSIPRDCLSLGKKYRTALRPGFPTMSPMNRSSMDGTVPYSIHQAKPNSGSQLNLKNERCQIMTLACR